MSITVKLVRSVTLNFACLFFCMLQPHEAFAYDRSVHQWESVNSQSSSCVQILLQKQHRFEPDLPTFVITHGMGGTQSADRFHGLADNIEAALPECNVILVDWLAASCKKSSFLGLPSPWEVAKNIDRVAREAAENMQMLGIEVSNATFIGESFGNCVNARIAEHLGRHGKILAFNPPNSAGGYTTPDLRTCADLTWSFHTFSVFDTQDPIAHAGFFLETCPNATDRDQHIAGISWLSDQVRSGNTEWILMQHQLPSARDDEFDAIAALSGELRNDQHSIRRRSSEVHGRARTSLPVVTTAL